MKIFKRYNKIVIFLAIGLFYSFTLSYAKTRTILPNTESVRQLDDDNSTTSNLGNGGVFTGEWSSTLDFSSAIIKILTNQDSAMDGFEFQTSVDGINVTHTHNFTVPANTPNGTHYVFTLTDQYYRIKYTNGITPQTSFNLSSVLNKFDSTHSHTHPINFTFTGDHEAQLIRSVLAGLNQLGVYNNINSTVDGALVVSTTDLFRTAVNRYLANFTGTTSTLSSAVTSQDTSIDIQAGDYASFAVNDWIELLDGNTREINFLRITAKPGSPTLTLNRPIDFNYSNGSSVEKVVINLASTVGSLGSPISYKYAPAANKIIKVTTAVLTMQDSSAMDTGTFAGMSALTNGTIFRVNVSGIAITVAAFTANSDFVEDSTTIVGDMFHDRAPAGKFGMAVEWRLADILESPVVLNGANGDFLELLIQDDVTPIDDAELRIHGVELLTLP